MLDKLSLTIYRNILVNCNRVSALNLSQLNKRVRSLTFPIILNVFIIPFKEREFTRRDNGEYTNFINKIARLKISFTPFENLFGNLRFLYIIKFYPPLLFLSNPKKRYGYLANLEELYIDTEFDLEIYKFLLPKRLRILEIINCSTLSFHGHRNSKYRLDSLENLYIEAQKIKGSFTDIIPYNIKVFSIPDKRLKKDEKIPFLINDKKHRSRYRIEMMKTLIERNENRKYNPYSYKVSDKKIARIKRKGLKLHRFSYDCETHGETLLLGISNIGELVIGNNCFPKLDENAIIDNLEIRSDIKEDFTIPKNTKKLEITNKVSSKISFQKDNKLTSLSILPKMYRLKIDKSIFSSTNLKELAIKYEHANKFANYPPNLERLELILSERIMDEYCHARYINVFNFQFLKRIQQSDRFILIDLSQLPIERMTNIPDGQFIILLNEEMFIGRDDPKFGTFEKTIFVFKNDGNI